jgi:hypothetical protein
MFRRKAGSMYAAPLSLYFKGLINGSVSVAEVMPIKWKKKITVHEATGSSLELLELYTNTYIR